MKERILTGLIGGGLLIAVLFLPPVALYIAMSVVCMIGMYELLVTTRHVTHRGVLAAAILFSATTPFYMIIPNKYIAVAVMLAFTAVLVVLQIKYHDSLPVEHTGFTFMTSLIFPLAFSCLAYLRSMEPHGLFYVFLGLVIPWMCDMGAYFIGTLFGKRKMCPTISPKKTVEGLIGGIVVSVLSSLLTAFIYQTAFLSGTPEAETVRYGLIALIALCLAPLSVLGDLFASIIKRQSHVKDFGAIFPGHGGMVDRFDSFLLVTPVLFILLQFLPLVF